MKLLIPIVLVALCGIGTASADVVTNTTCQVGNGPITSNPTNCSIGSASSLPSAAANITINQLTSVPSQGSFTSFTLDVAGSANAVPLSNIGTGPNISSNATSSASIVYQFLTSGPVRQGVITFSANVNNFNKGPGTDSAVATLSVGSLPGSCLANYPGCDGLLLTPTSRSLNFTLGNTFDFNFSENFSAYGDPIVDGPGSANGSVRFNFQLFEADGRTPVAIYAAPEPGTLGLLLTCLGGFGVFYGIRKSRANR